MRIEAQLSHDVELVDQALLAVLGREAGLLGKGLDCVLGAVSQPLHLVDRGEVALSQLLERLEHLMEALLVDDLGEAEDPGLNDIGMAGVELKLILLILEQFQSQLLAKYIFLHKKRNTCCW